MADKKKKPPYLLFILLPIFAIGVVVLLRDRGARQSAVDASDAVGAASDQGNVSPEDVQRLTGQAPDAPAKEIGGRPVERYSWRGGLQSYFVVVVYNPGDPPTVKDVYLNEEP